MKKEHFDPQVVERDLKPKLKKFLKKVYKEKSNLNQEEKTTIIDMVMEEMIVKAVENYKKDNPEIENTEVKNLKKKLRKLISDLNDEMVVHH